jgi:D-alanyl-lipoteichoic acid acyltransferase DltB (MBOAT superfamily)
VFDAVHLGGPVSKTAAWQAMLGYYAQLYFDFSGYSDVALGIARMFGLRFPCNFDSPLRATGIVDFYRRWHITLTRVIARFLFTPLSLWGTRMALQSGLKGWRMKVLSAWLPFWINFEVIALWHGATVVFVVFGLVHGLWYILETEIKSAKAWRAYKKKTPDGVRRVAGQALTLLPLLLTFALFRSASLQDFCALVNSAIQAPAASGDVLGGRGWRMLAFGFAVIWLLPNAYELLRRYRPCIVTFANQSTTPQWLRFCWRPAGLWGAILAALSVCVLMSLHKPAPFLYGGF